MQKADCRRLSILYPCKKALIPCLPRLARGSKQNEQNNFANRKSLVPRSWQIHKVHSTITFQQHPSMASDSQPPAACAKCATPEADPENPSLRPCITCKSVQYCSRDCKKADAKAHKKVCAAAAQEYMKTADVKMATRAPPKADTHEKGLRKWQFDT